MQIKRQLGEPFYIYRLYTDSNGAVFIGSGQKSNKTREFTRARKWPTKEAINIPDGMMRDDTAGPVRLKCVEVPEESPF